MSRYSLPQIAIHWLIVALFALNYIVSDNMGRALRTKLEGGTPEGFVASVHPPVGIAILVLMVLRVVLRALQGAPDLPDAGGPALKRAGQIGHAVLYLLLLAIPVSGLAAWAGGIREAGDVHEVLVNLAMIVIAGHVAMALMHQYLWKDRIFARMWPGT